MKGEHRPRRGPEQQIRLALDAVDIREETRHQSGSDQQGQRDETLMHQENIRFSARTAGGIVQVTKAEESLALWSVRASLPSAREDSRAATQKGRARTQNKVLVIMDYEIFQKQAYQRTGSQRDSISKVTDSIQRGMNNSSPVFDSSKASESAADFLPIPLGDTPPRLVDRRSRTRTEAIIFPAR